jgi:hypothetical protein
MGSVKKAAGTAKKSFDGPKFIDKTASDISKGWKSATGATARRHKEEKKRSEEKETGKLESKVTEATKAGRAEAIAKRKELEAKGRDIDKISSTEIARGDVRDVGIDRVSGAGVQAARVQDTQVGPAAGVQATTIEQQRQDQFRQQQAQLGAQLAARAAGQGMSPAQLQLQQATEENIARQAAARAGMSGAGAALARREAARAGATTAQLGAQQAAALRAQETAEAQQQQAQLAQAARGQDISLASGQAQLTAGERAQASAQQQQALLAQAEITARERAQESAQQDAAFKQASAQEQQAMLANQEAKLRADLANQGVDLDVLKDNAKRKDAASIAEVQSQLQQLGMSDDMIKAYMQQELNMTALDVDLLTGRQTRAATAAQAEAERKAGITGGLIGAGGAIGAAWMASDVNLKKNITPSDKSNDSDEEYKKKRKEKMAKALKGFKDATQIKNEGDGILSAGTSIAKSIMGGSDNKGTDAASDKKMKKDLKSYSDEQGKTKKQIGNRLAELMDNLDVYDYDYKDEKYGKGRQTSVMAQDLEKSEIGKKAIVETPEGKIVDYAKLLPAMLAADVTTHKRIMKLEDALKAKKKGNK